MFSARIVTGVPFSELRALRVGPVPLAKTPREKVPLMYRGTMAAVVRRVRTVRRCSSMEGAVRLQRRATAARGAGSGACSSGFTALMAEAAQLAGLAVPCCSWQRGSPGWAHVRWSKLMGWMEVAYQAPNTVGKSTDIPRQWHCWHAQRCRRRASTRDCGSPTRQPVWSRSQVWCFTWFWFWFRDGTYSSSVLQSARQAAWRLTPAETVS